MSTHPQNACPTLVPLIPRSGLRANVFQGKPAASVTMMPSRPLSEVVIPKVSLEAISLSYT
jgi:hypothetical protein